MERLVKKSWESPEFNVTKIDDKDVLVASSSFSGEEDKFFFDVEEIWYE